jgi:hypothetical protein
MEQVSRMRPPAARGRAALPLYQGESGFVDLAGTNLPLVQREISFDDLAGN